MDGVGKLSGRAAAAGLLSWWSGRHCSAEGKAEAGMFEEEVDWWETRFYQ